MGLGLGELFSKVNEKLTNMDQAINQSIVGRFFRLEGSGHVRLAQVHPPIPSPPPTKTASRLSSRCPLIAPPASQVGKERIPLEACPHTLFFSYRPSTFHCSSGMATWNAKTFSPNLEKCCPGMYTMYG